MGNSNWSTNSYSNYSRSVAGKSQQQIFTQTQCHPDLDPSKFNIRESVDSPANPNSTPVIVAVDETGSMGILAENIIKKGLGVIVEEIIKRKPITDPHIMLAAIGDAYCDAAPIQATQFEADTVICQQIEKIYLEGNGGGNGGESYPLVWWLALNKTHCDAINLRKRKGYLFTIGDEAYHATLARDHIKRFLGGDVEADMPVADLLSDLQEKWEVFHLITPTSATEYQNAKDKWRELLGERAIIIEDWNRLGEVIVSTMQINEGQDADKVFASWDGDTSIVVKNSLNSLATKQPHTTEIEEI
jgi:hypothetical protein